MGIPSRAVELHAATLELAGFLPIFHHRNRESETIQVEFYISPASGWPNPGRFPYRHLQDFGLPQTGGATRICAMNLARRLAGFVAVAAIFGTHPAPYRHFPEGGEAARTQASLSAPREGTSELEVSLFVQDPHFKSGARGIQVLWIPQALQKYCLGKTAQECSTIDYCIRTTNKQAAMCQNLGVDTTRLPAYPADIPPRRVLSVVCLYPMTPANGFGNLMKFFESAPKGSLDRLSTRARIKAKVKLTRSADDDQFQLLEVLTVPSS
jgi:hypothetical protein